VESGQWFDPYIREQQVALNMNVAKLPISKPLRSKPEVENIEKNNPFSNQNEVTKATSIVSGCDELPSFRSKVYRNLTPIISSTKPDCSESRFEVSQASRSVQISEIAEESGTIRELSIKQDKDHIKLHSDGHFSIQKKDEKVGTVGTKSDHVVQDRMLRSQGTVNSSCNQTSSQDSQAGTRTNSTQNQRKEFEQQDSAASLKRKRIIRCDQQVVRKCHAKFPETG